MMKAKTLQKRLEKLGVHVAGTSEEWESHWKGGLWIASENTPELFDYYGEFTGGYPYVHPKVEKLLEKAGYIYEWIDAGTGMISPN